MKISFRIKIWRLRIISWYDYLQSFLSGSKYKVSKNSSGSKFRMDSEVFWAPDQILRMTEVGREGVYVLISDVDVESRDGNQGKVHEKLKQVSFSLSRVNGGGEVISLKIILNFLWVRAFFISTISISTASLRFGEKLSTTFFAVFFFSFIVQIKAQASVDSAGLF